MKLNYNNGFDQDEIDLANSAPDLASLLIWDFYPEQVGETSVHHFRKGRSCGSLNFVHLIFLESLIFKESILFSCIYYSLLFLVKKLQLYRSKQLNYINTIYLDAFVEYKQNLKHIKKIKLKQ